VAALRETDWDTIDERADPKRKESLLQHPYYKNKSSLVILKLFTYAQSPGYASSEDIDPALDEDHAKGKASACDKLHKCQHAL
jgi:hypothetical protein